MATFAELGVTAERSLPAEDSRRLVETVVLVVTLPREVAVQATFSKERVQHKISKLFTKELQTGDPDFDDEIFVRTDTPEATAAFLASRDIRNILLDCVSLAGPVEIDGATVRIVVAEQAVKEDPNVCRLLAALLA